MESSLCEGSRDAGLRLIETLFWDGRAAPRWPLHLARLTRSARALGWSFTPPAPPSGPGHPARLRLTLDAAGTILQEVHPLPAAKPEWVLGLAEQRLSSGDPWLLHKSTRRALHDAARAALPPAWDEAIFLNQRDEVCEGSITNLFFDRGAGLRTPPLTSGLLPGVLRQEIGCPEEVLLAGDLPKVRLWVGNALRGLIPARLADQATG
ncbi:aminotransferase class IV [Xinfangfangia sp. D13-10-4-6]|uniref:aminotransferase class IV n=1 Tax=Pseudogemmobacter hezensis TaxID=2737662 RepID=UPI001557AD02|nr:aminotransferase class IV [Pseudogemmobacter hezensis]NPD14573.1 aminotransferase class IV [Pseudogemmobacter hezensis]